MQETVRTRDVRGALESGGALDTRRATRSGTGGPRAGLRGLSYEEGAARLRPARAPLRAVQRKGDTERARGVTEEELAERGLVGRKTALGLHMVRCGVAFDPDVGALVGGRMADMAERGEVWQSYHHIVGYLHDRANADILRLKVARKEVEVPIKCKVVAALIAYGLRHLEGELAKVTDPAVLEDFVAWQRQVEATFAAIAARYAEETRRYYLAVVDDRARWRRLPPFLR